jgi:hypothetical protein
MRIDRSDPADEPDDTHATRRAQPAPDVPDTNGKDKGKAVDGNGSRDLPYARPDPALQAEQKAALRAKAAAAYQQYDIDQGRARLGKPGRETVTPVTTTSDRRGRSDVAQRAQVLAHNYDLPPGYKSSPALKGDPYHPDSVATRSEANKELYSATSRDRARALGYNIRIPPQKAPFDSHEQDVFTNGKNYITPDVDGHNVTNGWKMFNRRGKRIGTYDPDLNYVKE